MYAYSCIEIIEQTKLHHYNSDKAYFLLDTHDVKSGFAYLRLIKGIVDENILMCRHVEGQLYLSSVLFRHQHAGGLFSVIHGPCISDDKEEYDLAFCLHSKSWINIASEWLTRSNKSWPTQELKQRIKDHGVLFVPIGAGRHLNNDLIWRISFSVGEKYLIHTFTHTQLLCYALMKILLKDVISKTQGCEDLLCSYFIKTILFWLSEELPRSAWISENLIPCFMRCFKRLIYCVEYSICPHYFIPQNNLFENKIFGHDRTKLLGSLNALMKYEWRSIFFSSQMSMLVSHFNYREISLFESNFEKIMKSIVMDLLNTRDSNVYVQTVYLAVSSQSRKLRSILSYNITQITSYIADTINLSRSYGNKYQYKQFKQCLSYLLQSITHDAVSGWLMVASLFYKKKKYNSALTVLSYALGKCTREKVFKVAYVSAERRKLLRSITFRNLGIFRAFRILYLNSILFNEKSSLIPDELQIDVDVRGNLLPSVAYAHFLSFLCHYHLNNTKHYQESLGSLQLTIEEEYFIPGVGFKSLSYNCLGVALLIVGDDESARQMFTRSIKLFPEPFFNPSYKRLSMMDAI
ncbi:uncharacterized protein LOC127721004 [Mytilus californianus]|uniref:uncharacterized protein LOC127721004 n=1 Tax=Mytilus californianus TaxID=6549 RepID=UPI0022485ADA|nr:uncharacterized protein LOC127721004 [Mytilus californianus]